MNLFDCVCVCAGDLYQVCWVEMWGWCWGGRKPPLLLFSSFAQPPPLTGEGWLLPWEFTHDRRTTVTMTMTMTMTINKTTTRNTTGTIILTNWPCGWLCVCVCVSQMSLRAIPLKLFTWSKYTHWLFPKTKDITMLALHIEYGRIWRCWENRLKDIF